MYKTIKYSLQKNLVINKIYLVLFDDIEIEASLWKQNGPFVEEVVSIGLFRQFYSF